jgi:hypothetical protein
VYNATTIPLQFYVYAPKGWRTDQIFVLSVQYWLDGKLVGQHVGEDLPKTYSVALTLTGLSDGEHNVKVWIKAHYLRHGSRLPFDDYLSGSATVSFRVEICPPSIRVLTSQETFEASDVPLNFTVNEPVSWIGYSLDGSNVIMATDDVASTEWFGVDKYWLVLSGLHAGVHSLTVYAEDGAGNRGASEPFSFTVTQETPSEVEQDSTPFSTAFAAVGVLTAVVAVSSGLMFYFKKRKL